ncbi:MAG: hypothetical protein FWC61_00395, partial [Proteobacteria bacterium]|nr:hypothetical protein [Pseudomonadota bacterium]
MSEYKNIFCASNPARLTDALWQVLANVGANNYLPLQKIEIERNIDFSNDIIFLPSRRAVRSTEKMLAEKSGGAVMLPRLVALGEEADDDEFAEDEFTDGKDIVSNLECAIVLAKMLDAAEGLGLPTALVVAKDLVRMMDYLENERKGQSADIDWVKLVGEQYAGHFQKKAKFLNLAAGLMPAIFPDKITNSQKRNADIRGWIDYLGKQGTGKVIVCGSTGSVPATADLMEYVSGLENGYIILPGAIPLLRMGGREAAGEGLPVTNPYYSELKFCDRIKVGACDVRAIEIGESAIGFFNAAFGNIVSSRRAALAASAGSGGFERDTNNSHSSDKIPHSDAMPTPREQSSRGDPGARPLRDDINFTRIDCARESEEAEVVAEITATAVSENKSVLIITPDAAGNQRLRESFARRGIVADFSGGTSGAMAPLGRAILNRFDAEIKNSIRLRPPSLRSGMTTPRQEFKMPVKDLFGLINDFNLEFSESDLPIIEKIKEAS